MCHNKINKFGFSFIIAVGLISSLVHGLDSAVREGPLLHGYKDECFLVTTERCEHEFILHIEKYNLNFKDGKEFGERFDVFCKNYEKIVTHNCNQKNSFDFGLNQFSHLTLSDFKEKVHLGTTRPYWLQSMDSSPVESPVPTSASIDWQALGFVSPPKDEGNCGSCYSFVATAAIESAAAIKLKKPVPAPLSNQQVVSCDTTTNGCNGGWMTTVWSWVMTNKGLALGSQYPYSSGGTGLSGTCRTNVTNIAATIPKSFVNVLPNNLTALVNAVALQPVAVGVEADSDTFQFYSGGIINDPGCGTNINHAVLIVGYGTDNGVAYWKAKNSWGTSWGEQGYVRILQSTANICGVLSGAPCYPVF